MVTQATENNNLFQCINENYNVYKGNKENDFDALKSGTFYTVNWKKVGSYKVPAKDMYAKYRDSGGRYSETKFGQMLTNRGIIKCVKRVGGKLITYRVGVSLLANDEDEDIINQFLQDV